MAFQIKADGIRAPEREYRFVRVRRWRFDFAWPDSLVAVECEGGSYTGGAHVRGKRFATDCEKYNEAACYGWTVLRVTAEHIRSGRALDWIRRALLLVELREDVYPCP